MRPGSSGFIPTRSAPLGGLIPRLSPLHVSALALVLLASGCVSSEPGSVALDEVVRDQERYEGERLLLSGMVRTFEAGDGTRYVVLEDGASNRVLLRPASQAVNFTGATVCVRGTFAFDESTGRTLAIDSIRARPSAGCAST